MVSPAAPALLHVVGFLTGASLYAMLLAMVVQTRAPGYRLTLATALLGVAWNVGELAAHALDGAGLSAARDWVSAASYAALGFLAAVAVHMAGGGGSDEDARQSSAPRAVTIGAYVTAGVAGAIQLAAAASKNALPSSLALVVLTVGLAFVSMALLVTRRGQPHAWRALWMTALGLFAVSALHLSRFHGAAENWTTELLGHHASIPLAFAILYQDYRFGFGDLFLKRALTLLVLVTIVYTAWSWLQPSLAAAGPTSPAVGALLALWVATALLFPWLRRRVSAFVDRVVLRRGDYGVLLDEASALLQACETEAQVVDRTCALVGTALNAASVTARAGEPGESRVSREFVIHTAEAPEHVLQIGRLAGGRRLLSDDRSMLQHMTLLAARRIDAIRLSEERYARRLREREISALAAEAELRALRAQVNPHFLFNALTTIGYLIQSAPARALDTLMRLTTLLRAALRSEGELTTLGHEQELIESYLEIERERFEERLETRVDIHPELATLPIPSLIVQPLVENAIKHGIARARSGGRVVVAAAIEPGDGHRLRITVTNSGAPFQGRSPTPDGGIGLHSVERRLRCYYGDGATFTLSRTDTGETLAELSLPVGIAADGMGPHDPEPLHEVVR